MTEHRKEYVVFRLCVMAWLFGWYYKYWFFYGYFGHETFDFPVITPQFPQFFLHNGVALVVYYLPVFCLPALFIERRAISLSIAATLLVCATILGLHIDTYNDMTFISSFWIALWLLWFAYHIDDRAHIARHAPFLAKCIIGLLFLGGTVGKLTPQYWSGEAFYNLVVRETPGYVGTFLLTHFSVEEQKMIIGYLSKGIIIFEGLLALSPLYPYRIFCAFGIFSIAMLVLFRGLQILSVLSCLAGMTLACLLIMRGRAAQ